MAGQQQQIMETIFNMKRRLLRKDDSDSDESDTPYNGRMQSLKRKAQYTRGGKPESGLDPPRYKKRIEHAGYHRYILHRNPPRFDPDGDIIEPSDDYEDEDDLSAVEEDPYADIKLEELLAPLASAADLPTHPSLSVAYTSKHLTNLTNEAGAFSRKEQVSLWRAKTLMTKLIGDMSYVPMGLPDLDANEHIQDSFTNGTNGTKTQATNGHVLEPEVIENGTAVMAPDTVMQDAEQPNGDAGTESITAQNGLPEVITNGDSHEINPDEPQENGDQPLFPAVEEADDGSDTASQQTTHRMTTRRGARAQAASDPSPPSSPSSIVNPIHPLFTFPTDSLPDRDFGLPATEAEDTRLLLLAFVQKQEEIKRAAEDLYLGMLQAERMRQDVFKWSKAEAHVGELSDGEDWYDREEWSLETDLLKGRDEEEDETQVTGKKSTRQRRTKPDKEDR